MDERETRSFQLISTGYRFLSEKARSDLFLCRKVVFSDRLNWEVKCMYGMEFDEYDNTDATYILGYVNGRVVCSVRFIETRNNNMITGTFYRFFSKISLPEENAAEASRLFVDKNRLKETGLQKYPVTSVLFLSMINYAIFSGYKAIYAVVNWPMYLIFKRTGWRVEILERGNSGTEDIYLIFLPPDENSRDVIFKNILQAGFCDAEKMTQWPLVIPYGKR